MTTSEIFAAADAANKKYQRNIRTCQLLSMGRGPDPFIIHADLLGRLLAKRDETSAIWIAVAAKMTPTDLVAFLIANG